MLHKTVLQIPPQLPQNNKILNFSARNVDTRAKTVKPQNSREKHVFPCVFVLPLSRFCFSLQKREISSILPRYFLKKEEVSYQCGNPQKGSEIEQNPHKIKKKSSNRTKSRESNEKSRKTCLGTRTLNSRQGQEVGCYEWQNIQIGVEFP